MDRWAGVPYVDEARLRATLPAQRPAAEDGAEAAPPPGEPPPGEVRGEARPVETRGEAPAGPGARPETPDAPPGDEAPAPGTPDRQPPVAPAVDGDVDRLALVARHTADAVVIYRPDGHIGWVNGAFERMTGWSLAEVAGADRLDLVRGPFTRTPEFARLRADLAAGRDTELEFVTRTKDGATYWVALQVRAAIQDGRMVGLVGVERDITPRRHAEERARQTLRRAESLGVALRHEKRLLSAVLGTIPHLVWWKNQDLRYVGANRAYLAFRGLTSPAEVVGRRDDQLGDDGSLGAEVARLEADVLASHRPVEGCTVTVLRDGASPLTFLVSVLPHREGEDFAGVIGIGADVSQVADLERQLAQASRLESIGQLAAGIAHEINTPVQYVSDNTRFVADSFREVLRGVQEIVTLVGGPADGERPDAAGPEGMRDRVARVLDRLDLGFVAAEVPNALEQSLEGLERVSGIVKAMKDFSHPGQGRADVDVNRVVDSTLQVSRSEWKYLAELVVDLDPGVGAIPCYEGEIKQVLLNVIVNAAQAIAERRDAEGEAFRGHLTVTTRRTPADVVISVTDDGVGMDEATRQRVFDPFFTTKAVGKGTGQGMSIAHAIVVVKHGGRMDIDSAPGRGTTFTVTLPVDPPPLGDPGGAAS